MLQTGPLARGAENPTVSSCTSFPLPLCVESSRAIVQHLFGNRISGYHLGPWHCLCTFQLYFSDPTTPLSCKVFIILLPFAWGGLAVSHLLRKVLAPRPFTTS